VGDPLAVVHINGVETSVVDGMFVVTVPLNEGPNTLTAVADNSNGTTSTDSILVVLDTTPPQLAVYAPADGGVTTDASITVTGLVNDIVVGTVNPGQATVHVNDRPAQVLNRTFTASGIPLLLGMNTIRVVGVDVAGNSVTRTISFTRQALAQPTLRISRGNSQTGAIGSLLAEPLVAQLVDALGQPIIDRTIVFRVTAQDGLIAPVGNPDAAISSLAVTTDAAGLAAVLFKLGTRSGAGNNIVEASTTGVATTALFTASALPALPNLIIVDTGNDQSGVIGQSLPLPFVAIVTDDGYNRLAGVPVTFTVIEGGGHFDGLSSFTTMTDGDGRVMSTLTLGPDPGRANNVVEATFEANPGFPAAFSATGLVPGPADATRITGVVLDNSNLPILRVTMRLFDINRGNTGNIPQEVAVAVQTDEQGQFVMGPVPVGVFKLMADGGTALRPGDWPTLEFDIVTIPGQDNTIGMPIFLPELLPSNRLCVSEMVGGTLTLPQAPGFSLTIQPGAATFAGGSREGCVSVTPVNIDKVPMAQGFGQQPRFVVTIQPVGAHFNPPAAITIPNVDGLAPRAVTEMYSYDHDLAAFVAIGTGTVSEDGSLIRSDPGVGVLKAGWHCGGNPNQTGSAGTCPVCQSCQGSRCAPSGGTPPQASPHDCRRQICQNGAVVSVNQDSEQPSDVCEQCRGGTAVDRPDGSTPADSNACCFEGDRLDKFGQSLGVVFDGPLAEKCPARTQNATSGGPFGNGLHSVDGCSGGVPPNIQDPMTNSLYFPFGLLNQAPTAFGVPIGGGTVGVSASGVGPQPCNQHDLCYQTCAPGSGSALFSGARAACDNGMGARMDAVCAAAYPSTCPAAYNLLECASYFTQRIDCFLYSDIYEVGLHAAGAFAFAERQEQYCQCCP